VGVFELRNRLVDEYGSYVSSFVRIKDLRIDEEVRRRLGEGILWPDPLIQLNLSFEPGESVDGLVGADVLHEECGRVICRNGDRSQPDELLRLHRHQAEAIKSAQAGDNSYIVPIVDHVLRRGPGLDAQAIVVYPMNALANSQHGELEKFLWDRRRDRDEPRKRSHRCLPEEKHKDGGE
jgi:ATP-dependent helicase YprA (DUF1998 family)